MYSVLIFLFTIALISFAAVRYRAPPFLVLFAGALVFGLATGMPLPDLVLQAAKGMGNIFALLGLVILSVAVIAKLLQEQGAIARIVADLRSVARRPFPLAGIAGYVLAVPLMCCITAFVILEPVIAGIAESERQKKGLLYTTALGSLVAFALLFPSPVIVSLFAALPDAGVSAPAFALYMIPVSLILLAGAVLLLQHRFREAGAGASGPAMAGPGSGGPSRLAAWGPFLVMAAVMLAGGIALRLPPAALIQVVMLSGLIAALAIAPQEVRMKSFSAGAKHAGVIIFDLCGAGALGAVIGAGTLGSEAAALLLPAVPLILVPFLLAALVQTAQGSRVVTAVITGGIVAGTPVAAAVHPVPLILLIAGGSCIVSYVTDPYFWLVQKATGDDVAGVVRHYTVPLALAGLAMAALAAGMEILLF